jgi:DNA-binding MarR family transcriptional regulator
LVLEFKGYNPTEVGLRKFLTEPEAEVLECLWEMGDKGECCKEIRDRLAVKGCNHSNATINRTLKSLEAKGVAASQVVTHSPAQLVYYTKTNREKAQAILIEGVISNLNASMPEAFAHAVKKIKP